MTRWRALGPDAAVAIPSARIFALEVAAPFYVLWIALSARGLLRAASVPLESTVR